MRPLWWMMGPLREAAGDGGGSGGSGSGAGTGGGTGGAFDAAAFQSSLMAEVNKTLNGALKSLKTDFTKALEGVRGSSGASGGTGGSGDGTGSGDGSGDGSGSGSGQGGKPDAATAKLQRQIDQLTQQLSAEKAAREKTATDALEKERLAAIRDALAGHQFGSDGYRADAFRFFRDEIKRGEDGELFGGDNVPMKDFIAEALKARTDWAPPKDVGGAGARGGKPQGGKTFDLNDIKPGMKPEDFTAVAQQIQAALQGQA